MKRSAQHPYHVKVSTWELDLEKEKFDRTQIVTVNEIKSSPSLLTCGVPHGSVLGPILFILYTQPLSDVTSHHSVSHHNYVFG